MTGKTAATKGGRVEQVEPSTDALGFIPEYDYADAFALTEAPAAPARTWARICLASGPAIQQRAFGTLVWHAVLGFDLAKHGTDGTMVGWQITVDEPDMFVLKTDGQRMSGCMVFAVKDDIITWTTAVHYGAPGAKTIWTGAQRVHRILAGRLLARAAQAIERRGRQS